MGSAKSKINILLIDSNDEALAVFSGHFEKQGIEITSFKNYEIALKKIDLKKHFDIIVANTMDSSTTWINFIKLVKAYSNKDSRAILIGSGDIQDLLYATEIEAQKYFTVPCDYEKVASYTKTVIDTLATFIASNDSVSLQEGWIYSFNKKTLSKGDIAIKLTKNEVAFLEALIKNNNKIVTYEQLKLYIYKTKNLKSDKLHAIRTLARNIRAKTKSKELIGTLNRIGYKLKIKD